MKLIIKDNVIVALATKDYEGPEFFIDAPENFEEVSIPYYRYSNTLNTVVLNDPSVLSQQTQNRLDTFAQTKGYDNISIACTYSNSSNAIFKLEGEYAVSARDNTWNALFNTLSSEIIINSFSDIEPHLPILVWPDVSLITELNSNTTIDIVNVNDANTSNVEISNTTIDIVNVNDANTSNVEVINTANTV